MSNVNTQKLMSSKHHDDEIYRAKKISKKKPKFKINLNEEQKKAKELILQNTLTVLSGKAGSGKTLLACNVALEGLLTKEYEKMIITRPTVSKEDIGFLPGDLREKLDPWVQPIYQNLYALYGKEAIEDLIKSEKIEIVPVAFMRGRTHLDAIIVVDEAQNVTHEQMEMITSRIGLRSKMIVCGDAGQVDLKSKSTSGFKFLASASEKVKNLGSFVLKTNHRDPIVDELLDYYSLLRDKS